MGEQIPLGRPRYPLLIPDVDSVAKDLGFASFFPPRAKNDGTQMMATVTDRTATAFLLAFSSR